MDVALMGGAGHAVDRCAFLAISDFETVLLGDSILQSPQRDHAPLLLSSCGRAL